MSLTERDTQDLLADIGALQAIQKRNQMSSAAWRAASDALAPLFAEMKRRQEAGLL